MLALLLTIGTLCQEPEKPPAPAPAAENPQAEAPVFGAPPVVVTPWDDKAAKAALDELAAKLKGKPTMVEKSRALEQLAAGSNKLLVKPLAQIIETEKSIVIRKRAAELLANQPAADANAQILLLLKNARVSSQPMVMAKLVQSFAKCGYQSRQWAEIDDLFEQTYEHDHVPLHEAILDLVIAHKEKQAVPMLLRNLDPPAPEDVHAQHNPPKEYWEARWKAWSVWKGKVKEALFQITGQRFSTAAEGKAWFDKNPLK